MEKTNTNFSKQALNESLSIINRNTLSISGINEVVSSSETQLYLKVHDTGLVISGQNIHINKIDIESGVLDATGDFDSIKYGKSGNIFKRIFK